jgi:hypothetical protein
MLVLAMPAHAEQDPECFPWYRYEDEFLTHFQVEYSDPGVAMAHCDLDNAAYLSVKAFLFLKDLPALDTSHPLDRHLLNRNPADYLAATIHTFAFEAAGPACEAGVVAAYYNARQPGVLHVCDDGNSNARFRNPLTTAGMLLHEARHSEFPAHESCEHGPLAHIGVQACDTSYEAGGAWAFETEFYLKVSRTGHIDVRQREMARGTAVEIMTTAFNRPPLGIRQGVVLKTQDGRVLFTDGRTREVMVAGLPVDTVIATWALPVPSVSLNMFNAGSARAQTYFFSGRKMVEQATIGIDENHALLPLAQRQQLRDIIRTDKYWCWLYSNSMVCWSTPTDAVQIKLDFEATSMAYGHGSRLMPAMPMIRSSQGRYFALPRNLSELRENGIRGLAPVENRLGAIAAIRVDDHCSRDELVLFSDRSLYVYQDGRRIREFAPGLQVERIYGPISWSRRLQEI